MRSRLFLLCGVGSIIISINDKDNSNSNSNDMKVESNWQLAIIHARKWMQQCNSGNNGSLPALCNVRRGSKIDEGAYPCDL